MTVEVFVSHSLEPSVEIIEIGDRVRRTNHDQCAHTGSADANRRTLTSLDGRVGGSLTWHTHTLQKATQMY